MPTDSRGGLGPLALLSLPRPWAPGRREHGASLGGRTPLRSNIGSRGPRSEPRSHLRPGPRARAMAEEAPRPPFDANSSPPYQCFFPLCWVERPTYLALNDHIKIAHPKVASSDFDGTFFGKAVRQERQVKNRRRFAAPAVEAAAAAGACADGASGAAGAGLEAARRRRGRSSAAAKTGAAGGSGPAAAAEAAAAVLAQRVADPQYVVPRQTGAAAGGRKARKRAPSAAAGGSGPAAAAPAPAAAAAAEAAPPRQVFSV